MDDYNIKIGATEIPEYLQDFINVFNIPLIGEVVDYKGFEYTIKTMDPSPYSPLYNLLEP